MRTSEMLKAAVEAGISSRLLKTADVKILADADVKPVLGEPHEFTWCRSGMEPAEMMKALARARDSS